MRGVSGADCGELNRSSQASWHALSTARCRHGCRRETAARLNHAVACRAITRQGAAPGRLSPRPARPAHMCFALAGDRCGAGIDPAFAAAGGRIAWQRVTRRPQQQARRVAGRAGQCQSGNAPDTTCTAMTKALSCVCHWQFQNEVIDG